jgi:hypothetical protein
MKKRWRRERKKKEKEHQSHTADDSAISACVHCLQQNARHKTGSPWKDIDYGSILPYIVTAHNRV